MQEYVGIELPTLLPHVCSILFPAVGGGTGMHRHQHERPWERLMIADSGAIAG